VGVLCGPESEDELRVASLDPGTKSGLVLWKGEHRQHMGGEIYPGVYHVREVRESGWYQSSRRLAGVLLEFVPHVLLYEDFQLEPGGTGGRGAAGRELLDPVRVTCSVLTLMYEVDWDGLVVPFQTSVKGVMTDERMRKWKLWLQARTWSGLEGHATDAARGLVWYLRERLVFPAGDGG
jgi:hypothetical protein